MQHSFASFPKPLRLGNSIGIRRTRAVPEPPKERIAPFSSEPDEEVRARNGSIHGVNSANGNSNDGPSWESEASPRPSIQPSDSPAASTNPLSAQQQQQQQQQQRAPSTAAGPAAGPGPHSTTSNIPPPARPPSSHPPSPIPPAARSIDQYSPGDPSPSPAPYPEPSDADRSRAVLFLYLVWSCCCWVERAWRFGVALVLAPIEGGFYSIALLGFLGQLAMFLVGPSVGKMLDRASRTAGLKVVLTGQNLTIALSALCILHALGVQSGTPIHLTSAFPLLILLSMLERVANGLSDVAMERDWVVAISGGKASMLSRQNAMLRRLDLLAELFGTFLFGLAVTAFGCLPVLSWTTVAVVVLIPLQNKCVDEISRWGGRAVTRAGRRPRSSSRSPSPSPAPVSLGAAARWLKEWAGGGEMRSLFTWEGNPLSRLASRLPLALALVRRDWSPYFRQQNLPASLAYIALFLNPVLSPGGLMTAFLAAQGVSGTASALFRSACAVTGFIGTQLADTLIGRLGLLKTGVVALIGQSALLVAASAVYARFLHATTPAAVAAAAADFDGEGHSDLLELFQLGAAGGGGWLEAALGGVSPPILWFCSFIVLSRIGLWMYDMVNAQIFQTVVPHHISGTVSASEVALCSLAELVILGVAAALSDPQHFGTLVLLSVSFVIVSCTVFCLWVFTAKGAKQIERRLTGAPHGLHGHGHVTAAKVGLEPGSGGGSSTSSTGGGGGGNGSGPGSPGPGSPPPPTPVVA